MELLGRGALLLALLAAVYAPIAAIAGARIHDQRLVTSARRALTACFLCVAVASAVYATAIVRHDFRFASVAEHSSREVPQPYLFSSFWSSQEGSLLLWLFVLTGLSALVTYQHRRRSRELMPYLVAFLGGACAFFAFATTFVASPFATVAQVPRDGAGLVPSLQNPYMLTHPPLLYLGYVGFTQIILGISQRAGSIYMKLGDLEAALRDYRMAIELSPPYAEVLTNLGQCYRLMGRAAEAEAAYTTSLDLNPAQLLALVGRAQAFEEQGKVQPALDDYTAALALNPDQPFVLGNRAILHFELQHLEDALEDLNRAIGLSGETPDLYQNRAVALTSLGRFDEAARDLETYLRLRPDAEDRDEVERQLAGFAARVSVA